MFVVQALYPFSSITLNHNEQSLEKSQKLNQEKQKSENDSEKQETKVNQLSKKEAFEDQKKLQFGSSNSIQKNECEDSQLFHYQKPEIRYLTFEKGDKILVLQSYENGWWFGNTLQSPDVKGFFPSNYIQIPSKPKPPPPIKSASEQNQSQELNNEQDIDWVQNQLKKINKGPVKSDYYLGIKGYKTVKIDDSNQNVLKNEHVKFDVSTGLAKVPIKDQAPAAKAVRQMGYYFDYHQWIESRNNKPIEKARADPKKKKIKKLKLKGMK